MRKRPDGIGSVQLTLIAGVVFLAAGSLASMAPAPAAAAPAVAAQPAPTAPPSLGALVARTKKQIKTINLPEFKAAFDNESLGLLIDVREEGEYEDGFIPGAVNIPRGLIEFRIWKFVGFPDRINMDAKMTLYCASGGRCALAAKSLQDLGFTHATAVDMKFDDWVNAGYPVQKPR